MSELLRKKFWKDARVAPDPNGFIIRLDDRPLRTPARAAFVVPSEALAEDVAAEWAAQGDEIRPETMPYTRLCNAAIDNMGAKREAVIEMLAEYGATDLVCYRAASPDGLVAAQTTAWDPLLDWLRGRDIALDIAAGIVPIAQPAESLAALRDWVATHHSPFALMALHDLVTLSGSLVIAMAVTEGEIGPEAGWRASRVDEDWQISQWGEDAEAAEAAAAKQADFGRAARLMHLSGGDHA